jgi:hypothetical protein
VLFWLSRIGVLQLAERHTFDGTTISDVLIVMFDDDKLICDRALGFKTSCFRTIPPMHGVVQYTIP